MSGLETWLADQSDRLYVERGEKLRGELSWEVFQDLLREVSGRSDALRIFLPDVAPGTWRHAFINGVAYRPAAQLSGRWVVWYSRDNDALLCIRPVLFPQYPTARAALLR